MSNYPLVYVDGIRILRGAYPKNVPPVGFQGRGNNATPSPLNDINPNDIERVEVIKGAAATTLFGTQAAAGVIQIFTKNGSENEKPSWTLQVNQGFKKEQEFGTDEFPYMRIKPWLKNAYSQAYHLSVGGGDKNLRYFVSGTYDNDDGVLPDDNSNKVVTRGNFSFNPTNDIKINWNTSFTSNSISNPPAGNNAQGLTTNAFRGPSNYFNNSSKEVIDQVLDFKINNTIKHLVSGITINYNPLNFFSNTFTVGYDRAAIEARQYRPLGFALFPQGAMSTQDFSGETITLDYKGNFNFQIGSNLTSKTTIGGQTVQTTNHGVTGYAEDFSSPGEPTLNSGGSSLSFEDRIREINYGFFGQQVIGYKDRYFLTLGLRFDGNSAFGKNLGLKAYPKVSGSYIISDEPFWNTSWGSLKLRMAYGHAGQAPGVFDATRTWSPEAFGGEPAFTPNTVGNANIGPERTIETTGGFNADLFNQRLQIDFTYYHQLTKDALLSVPQTPSNGFLQPQLGNVGRLQNKGIETSIKGTILKTTNYRWNLGFILSTNHSEILSLGGSEPFAYGQNGGGWIEEGYSVPGVRGRKVLNADQHEEPEFYNDGGYYIFGPNVPTRTVAANTKFELPYGIIVSARVDYSGGNYMRDGSSEASKRSVKDWPTTKPWYNKLEEGNREQLTAIQRARADPNLLQGDYSLWIYPADRIKLQNVTMQIPITSLLPNLNNATLSFTARNIRLWLNDDFLAFDPDMVGQQGVNTKVRFIRDKIPSPMSFTASLKVTF